MNAPAECGSCGNAFEADRGQAGGIVSCPRCGKAVEVPGLRDPFWRLLQIAAVAVAVGAGVLVGGAYGPAPGVAAGLGALGFLWLLSRAL